MPAFHEIRFFTDIAFGARGGPERKTDIATLRSGFEERNSIWYHSRRKYNAGYGVKNMRDLERVIAFFEERRGKLYGFRWKDKFDFRSSIATGIVTSKDQSIGTGNGVNAVFQLTKTYGSTFAPYTRNIIKPVGGTVKVAVNGTDQVLGTNFTVDTTTGIVTFLAGSIPANGTAVTAGFEFDVPVRFDTDYLEVDLTNFEAGEIPNIPVIELKM
ncbi:MAG: glycoside hydrolase family 24 [Phenylobacterium zucineum]|nr:MAG: glycoside hydrolase family 24 [Phenylobacterium zucineum]